MVHATLEYQDALDKVVDYDDDMIWVAFDLIDATHSYGVIQDTWITPCTYMSPTSLEEGLLIGMRQNHSSQPERSYDALTCERYMDLRITGYVNGIDTFERVIRWQPGMNGSRLLGFPRNETTNVSILFPEVLEVGDWMYYRDEPIELRFTGREAFLRTRVEYRRFAKISLNVKQSLDFDARNILSGSIYWVSESVGYVRAGVQNIKVPSGFSVSIADFDDNSDSVHSFPVGRYYQSHVFETQPGWTYYLSVRKNPGISISKR